MKLKIKELREESGMTQKALADKLDSAQRNVSNWENGISEPDCETILKIADLFDVSLDELFFRDSFEPISEKTGNGYGNAVLRKLKRLSKEQQNAIINLINSFEK